MCSILALQQYLKGGMYVFMTDFSAVTERGCIFFEFINP